MKKILPGSIYFLILCLIMSLSCDDRQSTPISEAGTHEEMPDQEGWNSTIIATREGRVDAIIEYNHMERYDKNKVVDFDGGVAVDFFDKEGNHSSRLTANGGRFYENDNSVEAIGNVIVISDSGVTLYTERLQWDQQKEQVFSNEFVTITTNKGDTLAGKGFVSDPYLKKFKVTEPRGVSARGLDLDLEKRMQKPALAGDSSDSGTTLIDSLKFNDK